MMQANIARGDLAQSSKRHAGAAAYHAGFAAETSVAQHYERSGRTICAQRWRGKGGEIDLVAREGNVLVFIEVKKSRTHAVAAEHLTGRQMQRIYQSASEYLAQEPAGLATDVRFDVALVDYFGQIEIIEQAFMA